MLPFGCRAGREKDEPKNYNIILLSLDTLRRDRLGCYGYGRPVSKNIDRIAGRGALFENVTSPSPWTLPSHVSLFTSLHPGAHGVEKIDQAIPPAVTTLSEVLKNQGYQTAGFCGGGLVHSKFGFSQGFEIYEDDLSRRLHEILPPAMEWLKKMDRERFFLFLHCYDIHSPYSPVDASYRNLYTGGLNRLSRDRLDPILDKWNRNLDLSKEDMDDLVFFFYKYYDLLVGMHQKERIREGADLRKKILDHVNEGWRDSAHFKEDLALVQGLYDGEIAATDQVLGGLFDFMTERNLWENTLFVLLSDHGEGLMDHGILEHTRNLHDELIRVPLIMVFPDGKYAGLRIRQQVALIDVMPTILNYLGIPRREHLTMQGASVLPVLEGKPDERPGLSSCRLHIRSKSLVWKHFKLIVDEEDNRRTLFDLSEDPLEKNNIINERPDMAEEMFKKLEEMARRNQELNKNFQPARVELDNQLESQLKELGYID